MKRINLRIALLMLSAVITSTPILATGTKGGGNALVCFKPEKAAEVLKAYEMRGRNGNIIRAQLNDRGQLRNILINDEHLEHIETIESFDLYEARLSLKGGDVKLIELKEEEGPSAYIERLISRFDGILPTFVTKIRNAMDRIPLRDARFYPYGISPENDFTSVGLIDFSKCVLSTMFVQESVKEKEYLHIDERLFNHAKHNSFSRAVGYLHEVVYLVMRDKGDSTSDATRKIVSELIIHRNVTTYEDFSKNMISLGLLSRAEKAGDARKRIIDLAFQLDLHLRELIIQNERLQAKAFLDAVDEVVSEEGDFYVKKEYEAPILFRNSVPYQQVLQLYEEGKISYHIIESIQREKRSFYFSYEFAYVEKVGRRNSVTKVPLSEEAKVRLQEAMPDFAFNLASYECKLADFYQREIYPKILQMAGVGENGELQIDLYFKSKRKGYYQQSTSYAPRTMTRRNNMLWHSFHPGASVTARGIFELELIGDALFSDIELDAELPYPE